MSWTPDYQFRASYVLWHLRSFTQMNFREFVAAHESVCDPPRTYDALPCNKQFSGLFGNSV